MVLDSRYDNIWSMKSHSPSCYMVIPFNFVLYNAYVGI